MSDYWRVEQISPGRTSIVLENDMLRVTILPDRGQKISAVVCRTSKRAMLWRHPSLPPFQIMPAVRAYINC